EDAKVALRNIRRDANDTVKKMGKASEISEDVQKQLESEIDKMTEKFVAEADKKMEEKTKEIMTV
ncbi:MAG: ribosome recycling factor, partial [Lachnospiraceae bacterium]|nr:ribosome recycling factor [Lachnospiraceae bacterium]